MELSGLEGCKKLHGCRLSRADVLLALWQRGEKPDHPSGAGGLVSSAGTEAAADGGACAACLSVISVLQADRWTVNPHFSGVALLSLCAPPVRDRTGRQRSLEYLHFVGETGPESLCVSPKVCIKGIALL